MTAKELFETLGYKQTINNDGLIEYIDDSHGGTDYVYIRFELSWKAYEVGYYDGNKTKSPMATSIKEHKAITKQMKELGWI